MHRILIAPQILAGSTVTITDRWTVHHLRDVLRVRVGEPIACADGRGRVYIGRIAQRDAGVVTVAVERQQQDAASLLRITLAQAMIRPERFEWMLQKATELGVGRIIPMLCARSSVRQASPARAARWRRIVEAATAQCGRATAPTIERVTPFAAVLEAAQGTPSWLLSVAADGRPVSEALGRLGGRATLTILIGPEGDFTAEEVQRALGTGVEPVHLAGGILRSETAALAALVLAQQAVGAL